MYSPFIPGIVMRANGYSATFIALRSLANTRAAWSLHVAGSFPHPRLQSLRFLLMLNMQPLYYQT